MRRAPAIVFVATLALSSCGLFEGKDVAEKAVERFHQQYNDESYGQMYADADAAFRRATSDASWTQLMQAVKRKLGALTRSRQTNFNLFSGTGGTTATLAYASEFAQGKATEEFRYGITGGKALLLAYNINSPDLILR
ncbi:MAG TPA: DUF4019 domain-containing protein [Candidatus Limnocylindria bacterium]|jgi:hypothetical protein|nr:DUF4019 domain-containing protein [Candidatus Limnocylindria bacterium]